MPGKDVLIARSAEALNRIDDAKSEIGRQLDRQSVTPEALDAVKEIRTQTDGLERDLGILVREGDG